MNQDFQNPCAKTEVPELERLSLLQCRELVGPAGALLSDDQLRLLRDAYYTLAGILCRLVMSAPNEMMRFFP